MFFDSIITHLIALKLVSDQTQVWWKPTLIRRSWRGFWSRADHLIWKGKISLTGASSRRSDPKSIGLRHPLGQYWTSLITSLKSLQCLGQDYDKLWKFTPEWKTVFRIFSPLLWLSSGWGVWKISSCYQPPYSSFGMFIAIPQVVNPQVTEFSFTFPRKCHFYVFETCSIWGNCKERRHRDDFFSDQSPPKYSEFWLERSVRQPRWIELKQCQQFRQCDEVHIASIIKLLSD